MTSWFEVDKDGLTKLLEERGKTFVTLELLQNASDQRVTCVEVELRRMPGSPYAQLRAIAGDPEGLADSAHAFTLFAENVKKGDPMKRGRFNLGEKLVIACCAEASIETTSGRCISRRAVAP